MKPKFKLLILLMGLNYSLSAQSVHFYSPNVVCTIDTSVFQPDPLRDWKMANLYHSPFRGVYKQKEGAIFHFDVRCDKGYVMSSEDQIDSIISLRRDHIGRMRHQQAKLVGDRIIDLNGFIGIEYIIVANEEISDSASIDHFAIACLMWKFTDQSTIELFATKEIIDTTQQAIDQFRSNLTNIVGVFTTYTKAQIDSIKRDVTNKYKLKVKKLPVKKVYWTDQITSEEWSRMNHKKATYMSPWSREHRRWDTYRGELKTKTNITESVIGFIIPWDPNPLNSEPELDGYYHTITSPSGELLMEFTTNDIAQGKIIKKCWVVVRSKEGLHVGIPFILKYKNK